MIWIRKINILLFTLIFFYNDAASWRIKPKTEGNSKPKINEQLQQFLFPQQKLHSQQVAANAENKNKPDVNSEGQSGQSYEDSMSEVLDRLKKALKDGDQGYLLVPLNKNRRRAIRSSRNENMIKLDLARTDIPWDIPSSVVIEDGVRKICVDMITSSPEKRKKSSDSAQYVEEDYIKKNIESNTVHLYNPSQIFSEQQANNFNNSTGQRSGAFATTCTSNSYASTKPPIGLNIQISNLIPPELACKTRIINCSNIDPSGNVLLNILFSYDAKSAGSSALKGQTISAPSETAQQPSAASINLISAKELNQLLEAASVDHLNKLNKWLLYNHTYPPFASRKSILKYTSKSNEKSSATNRDQIRDSSALLLSKNISNNNQYSNYAGNNNNGQESIQNPFNKPDLSPANLLDSQSQFVSNGETGLFPEISKKHEQGVVNTSLALRTLLGLIQLMSTGNNQDAVAQVVPENNINRVY